MIRIQSSLNRTIEFNDTTISYIEQLTEKSIKQLVKEANARDLNNGQLPEYKLDDLLEGKDILKWHIIEDSIL